MPKALTDSVVKTLKPERGAISWREVTDGGCRGLRIRLSPTGEKVWAIKVTVGGRRVRHTLGAYPEVALTQARKRAADFIAAARDGMSPAEVSSRKRAATLTLATAHADYIEAMRGGLRASTIALKEGLFGDHIEPTMGYRLIRSIRRADIMEVISSVVTKGFAVQANRVFSELLALLRWLESKGYLDGVPSIRKKDLRSVGAAKEQARRQTLTDAELGEAWVEAAALGDLSGDYLRLLILVGQRRDEVRLMRAENIDFDNALWTISGKLYKTGIDHSVPLSNAAMEIVRRRCGNRREGYIFAGHLLDKPFNGAASALRRLQKAMLGRSAFTLHDLRRTCRTGLSRLGTDEQTAELVIGHIPQGISAVYDLHDRLAERRAALDLWAEHVARVAMQVADRESAK